MTLMTLTAEKQNKKVAAGDGVGPVSVLRWSAPTTITLTERNFDRLWRCSSQRMLYQGRGELRALFEHGGDLYAIIEADAALSEWERSRRVRQANAMRVVPESDYQLDAVPFTQGAMTPERLQGMVVSFQGVEFVLTSGGVSFETEAVETPTVPKRTPAANVQAPVQETGETPTIPQGITENAEETVPAAPANVQASVPVAVQTVPLQTEIPPIRGCASASGDTSFVALPLHHIGPSVFNPRENFEEEGLAELAASIKESGLMQPITVRPVPAGRWIVDTGRQRRTATGPIVPYWQILDRAKLDTVNQTYRGTALGPFWSQGEAEENLPRFEIVAGERRWRASKIAETGTILALVRQIDDETAKTLAVVENLQRADLNPLEEGRGFEILIEMGWSQERIAEKLGCKQAKISRTIGLKRLPTAVLELIGSGALTVSHGQRLLPWAEFPDVCAALAQASSEKGWPVKNLEGPVAWEVAEVLKATKLVREISQYDTAFDWQTLCVKECPYRAFRPKLHGGGICLKPSHYAELQKAAKAEQATEITDASDRAKAALRAMNEQTTSFTDLPMVPVAPVVTPAEKPEPAPLPAELQGIPKITALKDVILLAEGPYLGRAGTWSSYSSGTAKERPAGCSRECPCAGAALDHGDKEVCQVCTDPKRFGGLVEARDAEIALERTQRAEKRRDHVTTLIEETRAEGLAPWEPEGALRTIVLRTLHSQFNQFNIVGAGVAGITARYGATLGEDAIGTYGLTPDGWEQLTRECSIPEMFLILAELRAARDAHDLIQGYGRGGTDFTHYLLASPSPRARGITLVAETPGIKDAEGEDV